jgi:hypothetical protein
MRLMDVLQEGAGQDVTDSLMRHLHDREYENMLHLVCMRMHHLAHHSNVNVTLNMAEMTDLSTQKAYLAKINNDIRLLKNVQSYHVSMRAITSASAAVRCLDEFLRQKTERPRILSGLHIQLVVPLPSDVEHVLNDFRVLGSQQANPALWTGLELSFSNTDFIDCFAPDFVTFFTALECLSIRDRHVVHFSPGYQDLRNLKKLSIGRGSHDEDFDLAPRELPAFLNVLPSLEYLDISGFFEENSDDTKNVDLQHLIGLTHLDMSSNYLMRVNVHPSHICVFEYFQQSIRLVYHSVCTHKTLCPTLFPPDNSPTSMLNCRHRSQGVCRS